MLSSYKVLLSLFFILTISTYIATAQPQPLPIFKPSREEVIERYKAVAAKDSAVKNTIYKASIDAHWLPGGNAFWYRNILHDSTTDYQLVNAASGAKRKAFNEAELANALSKTSNQTIDENHLLLNNLTFNKEATQLTFAYDNKYYEYNTKSNVLKTIDSLPKLARNNHQFNEPPSRWENYETDSLSPNKQYVAFIKDNNVFIKPVSGGDAVQYTKDGSNAHPYGSLAWSPDSKNVIGYHITPVEDSAVYYVLSSVPGTTRGQLQSHPYKQPGDPFTTYEMYVFPVQQTTAIKVNTPIIDFFDAPRLH